MKKNKGSKPNNEPYHALSPGLICADPVDRNLTRVIRANRLGKDFMHFLRHRLVTSNKRSAVSCFGERRITRQSSCGPVQKTCTEHVNLIKFSTLCLISQLKRHFVYHIPSMQRRQGCSKAKSHFMFSTLNSQFSKPQSHADPIAAGYA